MFPCLGLFLTEQLNWYNEKEKKQCGTKLQEMHTVVSEPTEISGNLWCAASFYCRCGSLHMSGGYCELWNENCGILLLPVTGHTFLSKSLYSQAVAVMRNTNLRCTWKYHRQSHQKHRPPQQSQFSQTVQRLTDKVRHLNQSLHDHLVSKRFQIWTRSKLISHHIHGRTYFVTLNGTIFTDLSSS